MKSFKQNVLLPNISLKKIPLAAKWRMLGVFARVYVGDQLGGCISISGERCWWLNGCGGSEGRVG